MAGSEGQRARYYAAPQNVRIIPGFKTYARVQNSLYKKALNAMNVPLSFERSVIHRQCHLEEGVIPLATMPVGR